MNDNKSLANHFANYLLTVRTVRMRYILFILCLGYMSAAAQGDYLVTSKGDTLRGTVQIHSYDLMDRTTVRVDGKKKNFTAVEVRFVFMDSARYTAVQIENAIRLMKVIKSGYLSLYGFKIGDQSSFDGRLLVKMNGSRLELPNLQFKRILSKFLEDCESTAQKVKDGELDKDQIETIVDDYNECIRQENKTTAIAAAAATPLTDAVATLRTKIDSSSLESKKDVLDLLTNIDTKARLKEPVPSYLTEGLKSYLADKKEFEVELNKVLELLH